MKVRFSTVDIIASIGELRKKIVRMQIVSIYDINTKTYLFKLKRGDDCTTLLIESGARIHATDHQWPKNQVPSTFSMKLRKHLRNRKINDIRQLGVDRIVQMSIGTGERANHLFIELFDRGNIILCDNKFTILMALRWRRDDQNNIVCGTGQVYDVHNFRTMMVLPLEDIKSFVKQDETVQQFLIRTSYIGKTFLNGIFAERRDDLLKKAVDIDACDLYKMVSLIQSYIDKAMDGRCKGYIAYIEENNLQDELIVKYEDFYAFEIEKKEKSVLYDNLIAFLRTQIRKALDEYFANICLQKLLTQQLEQERNALKKIENVKNDIEQRCRQLRIDQESAEIKAELIRANLDTVDACISVVRNALANELSWTEVKELVNEAKQNNNPIALCIEKVELEHATIVLTLESDDQKVRCIVPIDISKNAYSNIESYYLSKKSLKEKELRTIAASKKALKAAERKKDVLMKNADKVGSIEKGRLLSRKPYWFEKFYWFVSSDNYLVIGGRDQQENEVLVKKHLDPWDIYVHSESHGGSSVIVKNNADGRPIPPRTQSEAVQMAICYSKSWQEKVLSSAYWVHGHQVSKTAPTGEYLSTGSFMIKGKRNFVKPTALLYGCGLLFKLGEESIVNHSDERKAKFGIEEMQNEGADIEAKISKCRSLETSDNEDETFLSVAQPIRVKPQRELRKNAKKRREDKKKVVLVPVEKSVKKNEDKKRKKRRGRRRNDSDDTKDNCAVIEGLIELMAEHEIEEKSAPPPLVEVMDKNSENMDAALSLNYSQQISNDDEDEDDEEKEENLSGLISSLTGAPKDNDELLFCLPVFAPYSTLASSYKYKAKLQPGQTKRGKAGKTIINTFMSDKRCPTVQKSLIRAIKEQEIYKNIPGSVKISNIRID